MLLLGCWMVVRGLLGGFDGVLVVTRVFWWLLGRTVVTRVFWWLLGCTGWLLGCTGWLLGCSWFKSISFKGALDNIYSIQPLDVALPSPRN